MYVTLTNHSSVHNVAAWLHNILFRRSDNESMNVGVVSVGGIMDNFICLDSCVGDCTVNTVKTAFTANKTLSECCFQNPEFKMFGHNG